MSQNLAVATTLKPGGGVGFQPSDAIGNQLVTTGGVSKAMNQTATAVIKTGAGRVYGILVTAPGTTSGAWALNDVATTAGVAAANLIGSVPYNNATNVAGATLLSFPGGIPFTNGLVLTVPGAGAPIGTVVYS